MRRERNCSASASGQEADAFGPRPERDVDRIGYRIVDNLPVVALQGGKAHADACRSALHHWAARPRLVDDPDGRGLSDVARRGLRLPSAVNRSCTRDLIGCFDCVHDMGDAIGVLARIRAALMPNGTLMMVEPFACDTLEENLTPVGRVFYGASTPVIISSPTVSLNFVAKTSPRDDSL